MVLNKSLFDTLNEKKIQSSIDEKNNDFRCRVPAGIYSNVPDWMLVSYMTTGHGVIRWSGVYGMGWNPDTEHGGLNTTYDNSSTPL